MAMWMPWVAMVIGVRGGGCRTFAQEEVVGAGDWLTFGYLSWFLWFVIAASVSFEVFPGMTRDVGSFCLVGQ